MNLIIHRRCRRLLSLISLRIRGSLIWSMGARLIAMPWFAIRGWSAASLLTSPGFSFRGNRITFSRSWIWIHDFISLSHCSFLTWISSFRIVACRISNPNWKCHRLVDILLSCPWCWLLKEPQNLEYHILWKDTFQHQ